MKTSKPLRSGNFPHSRRAKKRWIGWSANREPSLHSLNRGFSSLLLNLVKRLEDEIVVRPFRNFRRYTGPKVRSNLRAQFTGRARSLPVHEKEDNHVVGD